MPVEIKIPTTFRKFTGGKKSLQVGPGSIKSILDKIIADYPDLKSRLFDEEGNINKFINIFLNEKKLEFPGGLDKELQDNDRLLILLAISGG